MSIEELRSIVTHLQKPAGALAALGAALDARLAGRRPSREIASVLSALAAPSLDGLPEVELRSLAGEIRTFALAHAGSQAGWQCDEAELLVAAGEVSAVLPHRFAGVPELAEVLARPRAAFLDVGVGVASLSVEMLRLWPHLRVVGIDVWEPSLALARQRIGDLPIELRHQSAEELLDVAAFDLVWIPSLFVPENALPAVLDRVHRALRPGGFVVVPGVRPSEDPLAAALVELRASQFGGSATPPARLEDLLRATGFADVRTLGALVTGRKASS